MFKTVRAIKIIKIRISKKYLEFYAIDVDEYLRASSQVLVVGSCTLSRKGSRKEEMMRIRTICADTCVTSPPLPCVYDLPWPHQDMCGKQGSGTLVKDTGHKETRKLPTDWLRALSYHPPEPGTVTGGVVRSWPWMTAPRGQPSTTLSWSWRWGEVSRCNVSHAKVECCELESVGSVKKLKVLNVTWIAEWY